LSLLEELEIRNEKLEITVVTQFLLFDRIKGISMPGIFRMGKIEKILVIL